MFETLYKNRVQLEERGSADYYQLHFESRAVNGIPNYFVAEKHGWWAPASGQRAFNVNWTINPDEGFDDWTQARQAYERQRKHRASEGYIHSYMLDFSNGEEIHEIIQVD